MRLATMRLMELRRQRITEAKRAGLRNRIHDEWHVPEAIADQMLDAWAIMAKERGLKLDHVAYWRDGEEWIRERAKKLS